MVLSVDPSNDAGDSGWAARFAVDPFSGSESVGHIGISAVSEKMDREARYRTRPESNVTDFRMVDTGLLQDVRYQHTVGLEMVAGRKSSTVRAEVFQSVWDRAGQVGVSDSPIDCNPAMHSPAGLPHDAHASFYHCAAKIPARCDARSGSNWRSETIISG